MKTEKHEFGKIFFLVLMAVVIPAGAFAQTITLGPYLQDVTSSSVVVKFELDAAAEVQVRYGPTDAYGSEVAPPAAASFELTLGGLMAGETYHYRVFSGGGPISEDAAFSAAPPPRAAFRLLVIGDTRSDHEAHRSVIGAASGMNSDVWVHTGDMVSSGEIVDEWLTFFQIEAPLMQSVPQFGAIGNHDESGGNADNYIRFYALPDNSYAPEYYYSFNYGNLHGIVLDGHVNVDAEWQCILRIGAWETCFNEPQMAWLTADLASAADDPNIDHIFIFLHMGPYSSKDGRTGYKQIRDLLPLFSSSGVDMIITGHDHYYERGFSDNGIAYVVSAGGGAPLYETVVPPANPPHSVMYNETVYHYVVIDIDWLCVTLTAYRVDGSVLDMFGFCSEPRACADPGMDCGALPPSCPGGRWVCDAAGFCATSDCEGIEPQPDDGEEPSVQEDDGRESEAGAEAAESQDVAPAEEVSPEMEPPDGEEPVDEGRDGGEDGRSGCGCVLA